MHKAGFVESQRGPRWLATSHAASPKGS